MTILDLNLSSKEVLVDLGSHEVAFFDLRGDVHLLFFAGDEIFDIVYQLFILTYLGLEGGKFVVALVALERLFLLLELIGDLLQILLEFVPHSVHLLASLGELLPPLGHLVHYLVCVLELLQFLLHVVFVLHQLLKFGW